MAASYESHPSVYVSPDDADLDAGLLPFEMCRVCDAAITHPSMLASASGDYCNS